jgi:hypothetical protein
MRPLRRSSLVKNVTEGGRSPTEVANLANGAAPNSAALSHPDLTRLLTLIAAPQPNPMA